MVKNLNTVERSQRIRLGKVVPDDQAAGTIILNATDDAIAAPVSGLYVAPIRFSDTYRANTLVYNTGTGEISDSGHPAHQFQDLQNVTSLGATSDLRIDVSNTFTAAQVGVNNTSPEHTLSVSGNTWIGGDLTVVGDTTFVQSKNLQISDPLVELGGNNSTEEYVFDVGILYNRPDPKSVGVVYLEGEDELAIAYTLNTASDRYVTPDAANTLDVHVYGDVTANAFFGEGQYLQNVAVLSNFDSNVARIETLEFELESNNLRTSNLEAQLYSNHVRTSNLETYATSNNIRVSTLELGQIQNANRLTTLYAYHASNVLRIEDLESNLVQNSNRIFVLSDDLADNSARISVLSTRLQDNSFRISVNTTNLLSNHIRVTNLESNLVANAARVTSLEGRATALEGRASNLETNLGSNVLRIESLESNTANLRVEMDSNSLILSNTVVELDSNAARIVVLEAQGLEEVANVGNSVSNTVIFTNEGTSLVTDGTVGVNTRDPNGLYELHVAGNVLVQSNVEATLFKAPGTELNVNGRNKLTGNTTIYGNLNVFGNVTYLDTENVYVKDPILGIGNPGASDSGVIAMSGGPGSNVAFGFNNTQEEFIICYTDDGPLGVTLTPNVSRDLNVHIYGTMYSANGFGVANTNPNSADYALSISNNIFARHDGDFEAIRTLGDTAIYSANVTVPKVISLQEHLTLEAPTTIVTGNLEVKGETTFVSTTDLKIDDAVIELANNNLLSSTDVGIKMNRPDANVLVTYRGTEEELIIAHSTNGVEPNEDIEMNVHVYGSMNVGSNCYISRYGHITANSYSGDGGLLSNIVQTLEGITSLGNTTTHTVYLQNATTGMFVDSNIVVGGNVTADVYYGDGSYLVGVSNLAILEANLDVVRSEMEVNTNAIYAQMEVNTNAVYTQMEANTQAIQTQMAANTQTVFAEMAANTQTIFAEMAANAQAANALMAANTQIIFSEMAANTQTIFAEMAANAVAANALMAANTQTIFAEMAANTQTIYFAMHSNALAANALMEANVQQLQGEMAANTQTIFAEMAANAQAANALMAANTQTIFAEMAANTQTIYFAMHSNALAANALMEANVQQLQGEMAANTQTIYFAMHSNALAANALMEANVQQLQGEMAANTQTIYLAMHSNALAANALMEANVQQLQGEMAANTQTIYLAMHSNALAANALMEANVQQIQGEMAANTQTIYLAMHSNALAANALMEANVQQIQGEMAANTQTIYLAMHSNALAANALMEANVQQIQGEMAANTQTVYAAMSANTVQMHLDVQSNVDALNDYIALKSNIINPTFEDLVTVSGNLVVTNNLTVLGEFTQLSTINTIVNDALIEVGNNNSSTDLDLGIIMTRPGSNVGVGYRGTEEEFAICHTRSDPSGVDLTPYTTDEINVHVYGSVTVDTDLTAERVGINVSAPSTTLDVGGDIQMTSTFDGSTAAPELTLYKNSATPANADYLGQIRFQGENSTGGSVVYSQITGKIGEVTQGSEDGIIEFAFQKNSTETIGGRWTSDALKLINDTGLEVAGDLTVDTDTLFVDVSADRVGVNTNAPGFELDVRGDANVSTLNVYTIQGLQTLSFNSENATTPPLQLTAGALNDGVGALRIDSVEPDIFLNDTDGGFSTVTFASESDSYAAFGRDNSNNFYITVRDPDVNAGAWRDDTLVAESASGNISIGYKLAIAGSTNTGSNVLDVYGSANATTYFGDGGNLTGIATTLEAVTYNGNTTPYTVEFNNTHTALSTDLVANVDVKLNQLANVTITSVSADQQLLYDGSNWINDFSIQNFIKIYNNTGSPITRGQAVYIYDSHNNNVANVALARANLSATMPAIGLVYTESIADGNEGVAIAYGKVTNVPTGGFIEGETVYVSNTTPGGISNLKPYNVTTNPDLIQNVGICVKPHATNGVVFVTGVGRSNDIPNALVKTTAPNYVYVNDVNNDMKKIAPENLLTKIQTLQQVTDVGNVTTNVVTFSNATVGLTTVGNVEVGGYVFGDGEFLTTVSNIAILEANLETIRTEMAANAQAANAVMAANTQTIFAEMAANAQAANALMAANTQTIFLAMSENALSMNVLLEANTLEIFEAMSTNAQAANALMAANTITIYQAMEANTQQMHSDLADNVATLATILDPTFTSNITVSNGLVHNKQTVATKYYAYSGTMTNSNIVMSFTSNVFYSKIVAQLTHNYDDVSTMVLEVAGGKQYGGGTFKDIKVGTKNIFGWDNDYPWHDGNVHTTPTTVTIWPVGEGLVDYDYDISVEFKSSAPDAGLSNIAEGQSIVKYFSY
jgi:hypothetical protein